MSIRRRCAGHGGPRGKFGHIKALVSANFDGSVSDSRIVIPSVLGRVRRKRVNFLPNNERNVLERPSDDE